MSKGKFIYNEHTLQYEKIEVNWKEQSLKIFGILSAFIVTVIICYPLMSRMFPTAEVQVKNNEIDQLKLRYETLIKQNELNEKAISSLYDRDANLYRMMFNVDPIDPSVLSGGTGGHDKYAHLAKFSSSKTIIETQDKVERLSQLIALQSKSFDTINRLVREKEKMITSIPSIKPVREDMLASDVGYLSGFGMRIHPIHKVRRMHKGIDFTAPQGTAIQATGSGEVVQAGRDGGYGNCVIIDHGYGYRTLYGHMSRIDVKVGQRMKKGQPIGLIGSTGASTGPHCHYEVHFNGNVVNPIQFVMDGLTPSEYQTLVSAASKEGNSMD
jgi:murein DD-endopeptidase MepM/ murein hydrolase activator NlpD